MAQTVPTPALSLFFAAMSTDSLNFLSRSVSSNENLSACTRSVQKIRGLFELRGSSWFQENPVGVARFVQIS